ncbi:energy transducer TonB family protein [Bartonella raoultii]|uniref:TonB family protein n=1 Tax=Bartonella raoultii TaxID=1457020 RepID=A0ABS7I5E3_9HYPH|nr:energy transducer TonB [Bartonella raoultii]MBX4336078.1 TonB family protein [Bartonella raoultii]
MHFIKTRKLLTLWIGAFICAFSLHVALGVQFYFRNTGVNIGALSSTMMLTFVQEAVYSDIDIDSLDTDTDLLNVNTEPEVEPEILQPDSLEQESKTLEEANEIQSEDLQNIIKKDDFTDLKPLEESPSQKIEDKKPIPKPIPKTTVKQPLVKAMHSSTTSQGGKTALLEDALLMAWLAKVQMQLEKQKNYVVGQRTSRAKGTVKLEFRVHEQGSIFSSHVVVSSGNLELDRLALSALQRVGSFPPPPSSKVNKIIRVSLIFS